ncbi:KA1 domain-containing protein [Aphelenchoides bicaudatus]|nr:KA1 domain-containing protein [Aphelenchoides bicaudatus]
MPTDFPVDLIVQAPLIPIEKVLLLLREHFGIQFADITQLSGYDDLNFLLENIVYEDVEKTDTFGCKLIAKFTNQVETLTDGLLDAQIKLTEYLNANGIPCPLALPSKNGNKFEFIQMTDDIRLPLRLFTFLPGYKMEHIGYSDGLYSTIGKLLAKFHNLTTDYKQDECFCHHRIPIVLECWDYLQNEFLIQKQLGKIKPENITLCENLFDDFKHKVLRRRDLFEHGIIHSDVNETNVLLEKDGEDYKVTGLIDFGDTHFSLRIFDISASLLYILMDVNVEDYHKEWPHIANEFLKGYKTEREVRDLEVCQISMCARLLASLIYGLRTVRLNFRGDDPSYILKTQQKGWDYLKRLYEDRELRLLAPEQ